MHILLPCTLMYKKKKKNKKMGSYYYKKKRTKGLNLQKEYLKPSWKFLQQTINNRN